MKEISLTQGKVALVSDFDYEQLSQFNWHYGRYGKTGYAKRMSWDKSKKKGSIVRMHHSILPLKKGLMIDHINGNGLDNRRENLRLVTKSQNMMNAGARSNSGIFGPGVCMHRQISKWRAYIVVNKKQIHLGVFETGKEAREARIKGAREHFKQFAFHSL